ncbi:MAG: hypothetical protein ACTSR2_00410 [Candidatus Hodarchaeales archaeon]
MRARTFEVFSGSTRTLGYYVLDAQNSPLSAASAEAKLYDADMNFIANLELLRESDGVYKVTIDTTALSLSEGKYIVEFSCIANGNTYTRRDYFLVSKFI